MSTHTPGPWEVRGADIYQVKGRHVAYTGPHHTPDSEYPQGCKLGDEANARLIAAAPELLDALETLNLVIGLTPIAGNKDALQAACNIARAAIRKAKGEQQ